MAGRAPHPRCTYRGTAAAIIQSQSQPGSTQVVGRIGNSLCNTFGNAANRQAACSTGQVGRIRVLTTIVMTDWNVTGWDGMGFRTRIEGCVRRHEVCRAFIVLTKICTGMRCFRDCIPLCSAGRCTITSTPTTPKSARKVFA